MESVNPEFAPMTAKFSALGLMLSSCLSSARGRFLFYLYGDF